MRLIDADELVREIWRKNKNELDSREAIMGIIEASPTITEGYTLPVGSLTLSQKEVNTLQVDIDDIFGVMYEKTENRKDLLAELGLQLAAVLRYIFETRRTE